MRITLSTRRTPRAVALVLVAAGAIACGESAMPSAPGMLVPESASASRGGEKKRERAAILRRAKPLGTDEMVCRVIDPARDVEGASIELREAGLRVSFPVNSLSAPERICLTAHAGALLTYTFQPHGLQFAEPITVTQDLRRTTVRRNSALAAGIFGGYLANGVGADVGADGVGEFHERFPTLVIDDPNEPAARTPTRATFSTTHFSGYAVASGYTSTDTIKLK